MLTLMRVVGLTGGIATGKSTVSSELHDTYGIPIIDADKIAHDVLRAKTSTYHAVVKAFGARVVGEDGEINRALLAETVFSDAEQRRRLNKIVHPAIAFSIAWQLLRHLAAGAPLVVLDAPLLFETGLNRVCTSVVVVACSPQQQLERLVARTGCTREHAAERVAAQRPLEVKVAMANNVIDNSGTLESTREQVQSLVAGWRIGPSGWLNRITALLASLFRPSQERVQAGR